jgi:hypothetical protein
MNGVDERVVIPAQAGIQSGHARSANLMFVGSYWIPACAGMTAIHLLQRDRLLSVK